MSWQIIESDCIDAMRSMDEASIDAIVCDPPYSLGFMGKAWDCDFDHTWTPEALRVLKPGGHLLAFGGTRTYHRLACAIEDAGFEIRDCLAWLYGSGFPKSLDVSKAIDKAAGAEREVVGSKLGQPGYSLAEDQGPGGVAMEGNLDGSLRNAEAECAITAPATPEAAEWQGWGTALKPAHEPIVLARKPLVGTVATNVTEYGTGALNVDGCRVAGPKGDGNWKGKTDRQRGKDFNGFEGGWDDTREGEQHGDGRWPANVVLDETAAERLDEQAPNTGGGGFCGGGIGDGLIYGDPGSGQTRRDGRIDPNGGASRFFYVTKASRAERNAGLEGFGAQFAPTMGNGIGGKEHDPDTATPKANVHPTVKPIALMRWLCRLVTPPGGLILDPFTGSGTTGCAAVLEDFDFIGVERESEYVAIARARVAHWAAQPKQLELAA